MMKNVAIFVFTTLLNLFYYHKHRIIKNEVESSTIECHNATETQICRNQIIIDIGSSSVRCLTICKGFKKIYKCILVQRKQINSLHCQDIQEITVFIHQALEKSNIKFGTATDIAISCFGMSLFRIHSTSEKQYEHYHYAPELSDSLISACKSVQQTVFNSELKKLTGTNFYHPSYASGQILSSRYKNESVDTNWTTISGYLISQLIGMRVPMSVTEASWTGLLNIHTGTWCDEVMRKLNIAVDSFPDVSIPSTKSDNNCNIAADWRGCHIHYPLVDGAAAAIGSLLCGLQGLTQVRSIRSTLLSNPLQSNQTISLTIGTSAAVRCVLSAQEFETAFRNELPMELFAYRINHDFYLVGGALTDGGNMLKWWEQIVGSQCYQTTEDMFNALVLDESRFLTYVQTHKIPEVYPYFSGERCPRWNVETCSNIKGANLQTTSLDMLIGIVEGILLNLKLIQTAIISNVSVVRSFDQSSSCIVVSGGVLESSAPWRQLIADVMQLAVVLRKEVDDVEVTSFGVLKHMEYLNGVVDECVDTSEVLLLDVRYPRPYVSGYLADKLHKYQASL